MFSNSSPRSTAWRLSPVCVTVAKGLDAAALLLLLGCVTWAPWPLGSNRAWAEAVLAMALTASATLAVLARVLWVDPWPSAFRRARVLLWCLALVCLVPAFQLWGPQAPPWVPGTVSEWHTQRYLLRSLSYAAAAVAVLLLVRTRRRCLWLLGALLFSGVAQSVLGLMLVKSGEAYRFLFEVFGPGGRASGTFSNPNHFAGYLALGVSAGIGLLIAQYEGRAKPAADARERLLAALNFVLSAKMLLRLCLVLMVIGIVLSHSRMGNVAFVAALLVVGLLLAYRSRQLRRPALFLVGSMLAIDVLIIGHWVGLERVAERLQATPVWVADVEAARGTAPPATAALPFSERPPPSEESVEQRLQVPGLAASLVAQSPLLGLGGGTFHLVFSSVKPDWVYAGQWNHVHNDYIEVAVEAGLISLGAWLLAAGLTSDRQPRLNRGVGVATLFGIISLGVQSVMEFGLQIPAIAFSLVLLMSLTWVVRGLPHATRAGPQRHRT
jgi:O-Antigen ligase